MGEDFLYKNIYFDIFRGGKANILMCLFTSVEYTLIKLSNRLPQNWFITQKNRAYQTF